MLVDLYLPKEPVARGEGGSPPVIRIASDRRWPDAVTFDTTQVVVATVTPSPWDKDPPLPPIAPKPSADASKASKVADAFASVAKPKINRATSVEQRKRPRTARYSLPPRSYRFAQIAARQGQFAWFGFRYW
jgi:hypothetical protein